jgi:hypothetical protein
MRGSRSIKAVLPTIGAGLDHAELGEVQDGTAAQAAYLEAVSEGTGEERKRELEEGLRRYCGMDVRGMVELAGFLGQAIGARCACNAPPDSGRYLRQTRHLK